jgi:hypothetical protein
MKRRFNQYSKLLNKESLGQNGFAGDSTKEKLIATFYPLFQHFTHYSKEIEEKGLFPNLFYESSITLISNTKHIIRKDN